MAYLHASIYLTHEEAKVTDHRGEEVLVYLHVHTYLTYEEVSRQIIEVRNY